MPDLFPGKLLDEICANGRVEPYREIVRSILNRLYSDGLTVSARYDVHYSNIEEKAPDEFHIRISLQKVRNPLDCIWLLLHEYGHFLSGARKSDDVIMDREVLAWQMADQVLNDFPDLLPHKDNYEACKLRCLASYEN